MLKDFLGKSEIQNLEGRTGVSRKELEDSFKEFESIIAAVIDEFQQSSIPSDIDPDVQKIYKTALKGMAQFIEHQMMKSPQLRQIQSILAFARFTVDPALQKKLPSFPNMMILSLKAAAEIMIRVNPMMEKLAERAKV